MNILMKKAFSVRASQTDQGSPSKTFQTLPAYIDRSSKPFNISAEVNQFYIFAKSVKVYIIIITQ